MLKRIPKSILIVSSIVLLLVAIGFFISNQISVNSKKYEDISVLPVETVAFKPYDYPGLIGVKGTVNKIVDDNTFLLGCQDACVSVPVKYSGQLPDLKQDVTIYGKLSQQNGKYVFIAETLKSTIQ